MKELSLVAMVMIVGMATAAVAQDHQMVDPIAESHQNEADQEKYWYCYDRGLTGNDLLGCKSQFDNNFGATAD